MDCLGLLGCDLCSKLYFGLYEAVRGRLICHKTWDRIVRIFLEPFGQSTDSVWAV